MRRRLGITATSTPHPEELATAVIDLAEYEYRGEAYARKKPSFLWERRHALVDQCTANALSS